MSDPVTLLIVGAGPTGLTLASLCRRNGIDVRLIDKNAGPSTTSKAIGLQYRVSELLAIMGIVDRFLEQGGSPTRVNIYDGDRRLSQLRFDLAGRAGGKDAFTPIPIMIPQSDTERLLGDLLESRGAQVEWNTELLDFEQSPDAVTARLRRPGGAEEKVQSRWLVSCEGPHSRVRKEAGIAFTGKTYPLAFLLADVDLEWSFSRQENHVWGHADGSLAAFPLPGNRRWRLLVEIPPHLHTSRQDVSAATIEGLVRKRLNNDRIEIERFVWVSEFRINCRLAEQFRKGRVFLAGDSAHIHSPTGGQGITTCMQDSFNLAWKLARVVAGAPEELLATYEEERLPHAAEVLRQTDKTTTLFFSPNPVMRLIRDYLLLPVMNMSFVQKKMFAKLAQLHVHYRDSRLSVEHIEEGKKPRVRVGDRCPDVAFRYPGSEKRVTLFQLLETNQPVVLMGPENSDPGNKVEPFIRALGGLKIEVFGLVGDDTIPCEGGRYLSDLHGDFERFYGLKSNFLCLIRPDGHLGLIQRPPQMKTLKEYLRHLCSSETLETAFPPDGRV